MSRLIKDFGYFEQFEDSIVCHADEIADIRLPGVVFKTSKDFKEQDLFVEYQATAPEEKTGFITITAKTSDRTVFVEHEVDEDTYVNALVDGMINYDAEIWRQPVIMQSYHEIDQQVCQQLFAQGYWVYLNEQWVNTLDGLTLATEIYAG